MKELSNCWSEIIDWSISLGNNHFSITINPCIPYGDGTQDYQNVYDNYFYNIENILYKNFPTMTWCFFVVEKTKKNNAHFHMMVSIKNFIDYNLSFQHLFKPGVGWF